MLRVIYLNFEIWHVCVFVLIEKVFLQFEQLHLHPVVRRLAEVALSLTAPGARTEGGFHLFLQILRDCIHHIGHKETLQHTRTDMPHAHIRVVN